MAFFDELGKKISQTGQDVVQKTKDTAETMRLNNAIADEEKRIQSLYFEIGKQYFALHADDYDPALEESVLCVKEANTKIAAYTEQLNRIKGLVHCPNCNGDVPNTSPFCIHCGAKMPEPPVVEEPVIRRCKNCGLQLPDDAGFCANCGTPAAVPPPPAANLCATCGATLADGMAFCTKCGTPVGGAPVAPAAPVAPVAPQVHHCANCGCVVPDGMMFCTNCGTRVSP